MGAEAASKAQVTASGRIRQLAKAHRQYLNPNGYPGDISRNAPINNFVAAYLPSITRDFCRTDKAHGQCFAISVTATLSNFL